MEGREVRWAIAVAKDSSVMEAITTMSEKQWKPLKTQAGITTDREVAETIHTMNKAKPDTIEAEVRPRHVFLIP